MITPWLLATQIGATQRYANAAVVSDHELASQAGVEIMRQGGNAVDAAVATGFALAVTYPAAGNLGGGGFMVFRSAKGETFALDYRETAPASASKTMFLDAKGEPTPDSYIGHRASGVPGTVAGLYAAHQKYGKLPWRKVVEPAVRLADKGFRLNHGQAEGIKGFAKEGKQFAGTWRIFGRNGKFYEAEEVFRQPELAATLRRIQQSGPDGFYKGKTAEYFVEEMRVGNGVITAEDLANYHPVWRDVLKGSYQNYEVLTMPPPSSGGPIVLMMLGMVKDDRLQEMGLNSAATVHLMAETMKRCFADRATYMGDPGYYQVPLKELLDPAYLARRRQEISMTRATPASEIKPGLAANREKENTTHYSIVDAEGNAVSNTYTLNDSYGSKVTVSKAGFILNNEMDDFTVKPNSPNRYNLIQGEANAIAPGKRPLSSMTPVILAKDGKLAMVVGSPGGPTIINTVYQAILNVTVHGLSAQRAVSAPRFHHQWLPDELRIEAAGFSKDTLRQLSKWGHKFDLSRPQQGSCHAIVISSGGLRDVGCDPRVSTAGQAGY
jgi:gamma-glutamyltranspeptidase / glutathione hydrolase